LRKLGKYIMPNSKLLELYPGMLTYSENIIIIAGMHHSGTSLVAAYLLGNDVKLGVNLQHKNIKTPNGYFEDIDFVHLQSEILKSICQGGKNGWPDWGYTEDHILDYSRLEKFNAKAIELLDRKQERNGYWGWKDPRTTLLLDFWKNLLPNAYFILVYSNPWEVIRSIKDMNVAIFNDNPDYALDIWHFYNQHLINFYKKNTGQSLLLSHQSFIQNPKALVNKLNEKFEILLPEDAVSDYSFFSKDQYNYKFINEIREVKVNSRYYELLLELNQLADIGGDKKIEAAASDSKTPKVSVIIPCYNQGEFLEEALSGIEGSVNQLYEIIIVNDGSTEEKTLSFLKKYESEGYHIIHQENCGLAGARNNGIKAAKAPYILPLDADNRVDPEYLTKAIQILDQEKDVGVVYANPRLFGDKKEMQTLPDFELYRLLAVNYIDACAVFRKDLWTEFGGFDPDMPFMGYEDWEFWIRIAKAGWKFKHLDEFLFDYRIRDKSMVATCNLPENRQKLVDYIINKHVDFYKEHHAGTVSYLVKNLAEIEQVYFKQLHSLGYMTSYSRMLHDSVKEYEARIAYMEASKFWKLKQLYDKIRFILTSESYSKNKKWKIAGKLLFLLSPTGIKMMGKLVKKIFKGIYLLIFRKHWGSSRWDAYQDWIAKNFPKELDLKEFILKINIFKYKPKVSIILPVYNPPPHFFIETLESVKSQIYPDWELCIADDNSTDLQIRAIIEKYAGEDSRIKYVFREENGHISACTNSALELASGEFALFIDHDDLLTRDAAYHMVDLLNNSPQADLIYADEDKVNEDGYFTEPHFKPQWCPDNLLSRNYFGHPVMIRMELVKKLGGLRIGFEGSQDYDLVLRVTEKTKNIFHIPRVLYHWRIHEKSAAKSEEVKPYAYQAAKQALTEALSRRKEPGKVDFLPGFRGYSIRYEIQYYDLVSIIIPTKDKSEVLDKCLHSVFEKSTYPNFEVIVLSNNSEEKELFDMLEKWKVVKKDKFSYYKLDVPFNFSVINNDAAKKARGKYLLFLNNDTEVITPDWIEAMVEQAQRNSIGVVGVKLLYYNKKIQHAGVVIGLGGAAGHTFVGLHKDGPGYFNYVNTINNYSAITAACMMCRKDVFYEVNGFDEEFQIEYNDIDFCLKVKEKGYNNVFLPHVNLFHYESMSRGNPFLTKASYNRHLIELARFRGRWQHFIEDDPCYSPHLSRGVSDFQIAI
jgi:GT2 family glycosyltransferase